MTAANTLSRMKKAKTRSTHSCAFNPHQPARLNNPFASYENEMQFNSMLPTAQALKKASGTRYTARYLVKFYKTPQALANKLAWVRGCNGSVG